MLYTMAITHISNIYYGTRKEVTRHMQRPMYESTVRHSRLRNGSDDACRDTALIFEPNSGIVQHQHNLHGAEDRSMEAKDMYHMVELPSGRIFM